MAINIHNDAMKAVKDLRGNHSFDDLLTALGPVIMKRIRDAGRSAVEVRVQHTAHADGMYELWESLVAAYQDIPPAQVPQPKAARSRGDANAS